MMKPSTKMKREQFKNGAGSSGGESNQIRLLVNGSLH